MTRNTAANAEQGANRQNLGRQQKAGRQEKGQQEKGRAALELDRCYGAIGISAVAAALRYQSEVKNPAYAPAVHRLDTDDIDAAA